VAFDIILSPRAAASLKSLPARTRSEVRDNIEKHLRHEPTKISRSRIKRLRGLRQPQYRLRVGEVRIFYDIVGSTVEVLAILAKSEAEQWLSQYGEPG
jgi:mRNA-degrading endonuclease RelE of RelBE toxin-antitoxin system